MSDERKPVDLAGGYADMFMDGKPPCWTSKNWTTQGGDLKCTSTVFEGHCAGCVFKEREHE